MTFTTAMTKRLGLTLLAGAAMLGAGAAPAQVSPAYAEDPGAALTRHLKSLSDNPRSLHALMGAGEAALKLGDPQASVTFFARAEEIAPRDGRIKAGMGAAFVQMEQPHSALKFFADASILGVPEAEFAGDRGLAFDLIGNNAQAQRDYRTSLRARRDPEVERRLALSLAIAGDKAGAIAAIDRQLRDQDRAAWRTRAFVLALTGDTAGATRAVQAVMPAQAAAMQPFLARLASLDPAGRAMAVHFGHFPGDVRSIQVAQATPYVPPRSASANQPGRPDAGQAAFGPPPQPAPNVRRRPDAAATTAPTAARTVPARSPAATPARGNSGSMTLAERMAERQARRQAATPAPVERRATQLAQAVGAPVAGPASSPGAPVATPPQPIAQPSPATQAAPSADRPVTSSSPDYVAPTLAPFGPPAFDASGRSTATAAPPVGIQTVAVPESTIPAPPPAEAQTPAPAAEQAAAPQPDAAKPDAPAPRKPLDFAEVVEAVRSLPDAARAPAAKADAEVAAPAEAAERRHWVQIASAPDSLVESEYRRLKRKHSALLSDKEGYRAPMGKSNRVLVGPFASASEARDFVGALKKNSLTAIQWTSADGQAVEKLPAS